MCSISYVCTPAVCAGLIPRIVERLLVVDRVVPPLGGRFFFGQVEYFTLQRFRMAPGTTNSPLSRKICVLEFGNSRNFLRKGRYAA